MLVSILFVRKFMYQPIHIYNDDTSHRTYCRGWACSHSKETNETIESFNEMILRYKNGTLNASLRESIDFYHNNNFSATNCLLGFLHMIGFEDFHRNLSLSYDFIKVGLKYNNPTCAELYAFHPFNKKDVNLIKKAADSGSLLAKYYIISNGSEDFIDSIFDYYNEILTLSTFTWLKYHKTSKKFSDLIKKLTINRVDDINGVYKKLLKKAINGNMLASLWVMNGITENKTNVTTKEDLIPYLHQFLYFCLGRFDPNDIINQNSNDFNRMAALDYFSNSGDDFIKVYQSYPSLVKRHRPAKN